jgi:hypothetical protein
MLQSNRSSLLVSELTILGCAYGRGELEMIISAKFDVQDRFSPMTSRPPLRLDPPNAQPGRWNSRWITGLEDITDIKT